MFDIFSMILDWFFPKPEPKSDPTPDPRAKLAGEVRRAHRLRNVLVSNLAAAKGISYFSASDLLLITPRSEWMLPPLSSEAEEIRGGSMGLVSFNMMISPLSESEYEDCKANWERYTSLIKHYHDHGYWDGESPLRPEMVAGNGVVLVRLSGAREKIEDILTTLHLGTKIARNMQWELIPDPAIYLQENGTYDLCVRLIQRSGPKTEEVSHEV